MAMDGPNNMGNKAAAAGVKSVDFWVFVLMCGWLDS